MRSLFNFVTNIDLIVGLNKEQIKSIIINIKFRYILNKKN
jgi:hypothetical protein